MEKTKHRLIVVSCLLLLAVNAEVRSEVRTDSSTADQPAFSILQEDAIAGFNGCIKILSAPIHFTKNDWITAGFVTGVTLSPFAIDEPVRSFSAHQHGKIQNDVMDVGHWYGTIQSPLLIGGGIYFGGILFKDGDLRTTGRMVLEAVAVSGIITSVIKTAIGRSRPYTEEGVLRFRGMQFDVGTTSFPSGHATVAFAISTVLAKRCGNDVIACGLYGLAGITAVSRIYHDDHWLSDVILGSCIGWFVGDAVVEEEEQKAIAISWRILPTSHGILVNIIF
jgi:membrane-associated phospholipid phosphatase